MYRLILLSAFLLIYTSTLKSQDLLSDSAVKEPATVVRISFITPGIQIEQRIVRNSTIVFDAWAGISYFQFRTPEYIKSRFSFIPGITVMPRFYRDLEIRKANNKITDCYSGTYIGIPLSVFSIDAIGFSGGVVGGFQKKLGKSGFWNLDVGACLRHLENNRTIVPLINLRMGFMIY